MRQEQVISRLNQIASSVMRAAEVGSIESVLERIAHASRELIGARYAALSVPTYNGEGLLYFKVAGLNQSEIDRIAHPPRGIGLLGLIASERQTLRLDRIADHPKAVGFPPGHPNMISLLGVPIQVGESNFGTLYLCDREDGQPFTEEDEWLIEALAGYAALAIASVRLHEQQSRMALLEERERISMDLHDGVIQSLYGLGMQLEQLRRHDGLEGEQLEPFIHALNDVIDEIRGYIHQLKTRNHEQISFYETLSLMANRLSETQALTIEIEAPQTAPPFPPITFDAILQMVHEALSNAVRHADASRIVIRVDETGSQFSISVADDGRGFDPAMPQKGLGLANLQRRAAMLQGNVTIESWPGEGTEITIYIPLHAA